MIKVCTSGYYDPLHVGHLSSFVEAKQLGDWLTVIVNNDKQIIRKKGFYLMSLNERVEIIKNLKIVDEVIVSVDKDELVCETLKIVRPDIFAKGGEWAKENMPQRMVETCKKLNCKIVWGLGENPPVHHSSDYIRKLIEVYNKGVMMPNYYCDKINQCQKIKMIQDKDMMEFQYKEAIKDLCGKCKSIKTN